MRTAVLLFASCFGSGLHASDAEAMLMLTDYVGVDYAEAVVDGKVVNEFEYAEMEEFSGEIRRLANLLENTPTTLDLQAQAENLAVAIRNREPVEQIRKITGNIRLALLNNYDIASLPRQIPDPSLGQSLYQASCAACHGAMGDGAGEFAAELDPPPTDFTDADRASQRSVYGLYAAISRGVDGTAMQAFGNLDEHERWSLAYYTGSLHVSDKVRQEAPALYEAKATPFTIEKLNTSTPAEIAIGDGPEAAAIYAWLRLNPQRLYESESNDPLAIAVSRLVSARDAYRSGESETALQLAVDAYLEGFELIETSLANIDSELTLSIETRMVQLRRSIRQQDSLEIFESQAESLVSDLRRARSMLDNQAMSPGIAYSSALIILLREGLEAILILGAIAAFLRRTGRERGMRYLHMGWVSALLLGILTWLISSYVISISGATRELTEGVTALFAAVVLFYVGFWMHNKLSTQQWAKFIQEKLSSALDRQTLLGISLLSFIAVYREVFETVLFYQALWNQAGTAGQNMIVAGFVSASVLLVVATWLIFRAGARLPLKLFFSSSAIIMFVLAVIFAGKGIAAMVEAGYIDGVPVNFMRIDLLGIFPELTGLGIQLAMLIVAGALFVHQRNAAKHE